LIWSSWSIDGRNPPLVKLLWKERNGPRVDTPMTKSLGSTLIERGIPGATVKREFRPDGLLCTIEFPLGEVSGDGSGA
jgi:two-component system CheB/CheR fusion protein